MKIFDQTNQTKFLEASAPFYEVYFLKFHLIEEGLAFWVRYTLHRPKNAEAHASLWAFVFDAQKPSQNGGVRLNDKVEKLRFDSSPFRLRVGENFLSNELCVGSLQKENFSLQWDLKLEGAESPLELFPYTWMYRLKMFPKTKYVTVRPKLFFSGKVKWNGKEYFVNKTPGMQSHLWGSQHAKNFLWAHCNTFVEDSEALFEGLSACVKVGPWLSPPLGVFYIRMFGKEYFLNSPRVWFQKDIRRDLEEWNFDIRQNEDRFIGSVGADPSQFLGVRYTDPQGDYRYCNHTEWAMASIEHYKMEKGRWCMEGSITSKAATYEWVDSEPHKSVGVSVLG